MIGSARSQRVALLVALGIDNVGSGLFLPLAVLYATKVVGLPLGVAGTAITAGATAGLLVPPFAGRLVDRTGPRAVVTGSQLVQAAGALGYLLAGNLAMVVLAAILLTAGQQLFYCALFALIADVSGAGRKDRPMAVVGMVRSACFGLGGLAAGGLLAGAGTAGLRVAAGVDGASFLVAALVLTCLRAPRPPAPTREPKTAELRHSTVSGDGRYNDHFHSRSFSRRRRGGARTRDGVRHDRPYLVLIVVSGLFGLAVDFYLVGIPVYVLDRLHGPAWLPGASLALLTAITSLGALLALRLTGRLARTSAMALGASLYVVWCAVALAAVLVPDRARPAYLLASTLIIAAANLVFGPRANALAEAAAPRAVRGRYLAAFQYAFTAAQVVTPAVVALFALATWLPWLVVAVCSGLSVAGLRWLTPRLPPSVA